MPTAVDDEVGPRRRWFSFHVEPAGGEGGTPAHGAGVHNAAAHKALTSSQSTQATRPLSASDAFVVMPTRYSSLKGKQYYLI